MSNFPPELLFDILLRLRPKDLIRSMCVSKAWYAAVHDKHFRKAHLQRPMVTNSARTILLWSCNLGSHAPPYYLSLPLNIDDETIGAAVRIEQPLKHTDRYTFISGNSIHGVVCMHDKDDTNRNMALWNPSIQKYKMIPFPHFMFDNMKKLTPASYGFGYDLANDDYKIVAVATIVNFNPISSTPVKLYSLKSNSWKTMQSLPRGFVLHSNNIVFLNGALIWLVYQELECHQYMIIALDLATEKYRQFRTPVGGDGDYELSLEVLGVYLCVCVNQFNVRNDIWIMLEYGVKSSWTLLYSIEQGAIPWEFDYCKPLAFAKNGQMVLIRKDEDRLFWFDLEKRSVKPVEIHGLPRKFEATICLESLCLLDGYPVIFEEQQQVPSASKKKKFSGNEFGSQI